MPRPVLEHIHGASKLVGQVWNMTQSGCAEPKGGGEAAKSTTKSAEYLRGDRLLLNKGIEGVASPPWIPTDARAGQGR